MCRLLENVFQNLFLRYRSCRIGILEFFKANFKIRVHSHVARAIIMAVNHTVNHSIAKYCHVKGYFWVFRWRYIFKPPCNVLFII